MQTISTNFLPDELWWGGTSEPADRQGYDCRTVKTMDVQKLGNQSAPLYLSSQGRYIWADSPMTIAFDAGTITASGKNVTLVQAGTTLRDAYLGAMKAHFPFENKPLPEVFFTTAQYNTWMEVTYDPTQESVLKYAHAVVDNGFTPGILIIDEGWHVHYGTWEFDFVKFPDPKAMVDELHALGFTVMLWIVPYVTADGRAFLEHYEPWVSELMRKEYEPRLLRQPNGELAVLKWWNGFSAMLNLTQDNDVRYLEGRLRYLMDTYGVDGFKFDGGNIASLQAKNWLTEPPVETPEEINRAWNEFGTRFTFHEYKDTYGRGGKATIQRIRDRNHDWSEDGLGSLVSIALMQGLLGYPYVCPDMIGGGQWTFTLDPLFECDQELFVRMAQCSALFPMMQFSWAPWRMLTKENQRLCVEAAQLHGRYAELICRLVRETPQTGEPILRSMEYMYPHQGYERVYDQFLLGDGVLVCPVLTQGAVTRRVQLPEGKWKYCDGTVYTGGQEITVDAPLHVLPCFEKV